MKANMEEGLAAAPPVELRPAETALVICDVWNAHWYPPAARRIHHLAPRINRFAVRLRHYGALIIHSPSGTTDCYRDAGAWKKIAEAPQKFSGGMGLTSVSYPLPQLTDPAVSQRGYRRVWTAQHSAIRIDHRRDILSDSGALILNYLTQRGIRRLLYTGVHTNACILNRDFGIPSMQSSGMETLLIGDLTDCLWDPGASDADSWEEANEKMLDYYRAHFCPVMTSNDVIHAFEKNNSPEISNFPDLHDRGGFTCRFSWKSLLFNLWHLPRVKQ